MDKKPNKPSRNVDYTWFRAMMEKTGKSQNKIALQIGMADGSTLSKYLTGDVEVPVDRAVGLSKAIGAPFLEVVKRLGYVEMAGRPVMQQGKIDASGNVKPFASPAIVSVSPDSNSTACWLVDAGELKGALVFVAVNQVPSECVGKICVVSDEIGTRVRIVSQEPGMRADRFNLLPCLGFDSKIEKGVPLAHVMPVTSIDLQRFS